MVKTIYVCGNCSDMLGVPRKPNGAQEIGCCFHCDGETRGTVDRKDTAAPGFLMAKADTPLVMQVGCSACRSVQCIVAVVVPGFHYPCPVCAQKVDKGVVIACASCGMASCAPCVYAAYVKTRAAQLTAD